MALVLVLVVAALVLVDMLAKRPRRQPPSESAITTQKIVVDLTTRR